MLEKQLIIPLKLIINPGKDFFKALPHLSLVTLVNRYLSKIKDCYFLLVALTQKFRVLGF